MSSAPWTDEENDLIVADYLALLVNDIRRLFRLWNFSREAKAFELHTPLNAHVSLTATTFQASFH